MSLVRVSILPICVASIFYRSFEGVWMGELRERSVWLASREGSDVSVMLLCGVEPCIEQRLPPKGGEIRGKDPSARGTRPIVQRNGVGIYDEN